MQLSSFWACWPCRIFIFNSTIQSSPIYPMDLEVPQNIQIFRHFNKSKCIELLCTCDCTLLPIVSFLWDKNVTDTIKMFCMMAIHNIAYPVSHCEAKRDAGSHKIPKQNPHNAFIGSSHNNTNYCAKFSNSPEIDFLLLNL